jgi:hypothetical protein
VTKQNWVVSCCSCLVLAACAFEIDTASETDDAELSQHTAALHGPEGEAVIRWLERTLEAVREQNVPTPDAGRLYAMVTVAMYDAVNGIERTHQPYHVTRPAPPATLQRRRRVRPARHRRRVQGDARQRRCVGARHRAARQALRRRPWEVAWLPDSLTSCDTELSCASGPSRDLSPR